MAEDPLDAARRRLATLADVSTAECAPARRLGQDAALLGRLLTAAGQRQNSGLRADMVDEVAAALSLFGQMRVALDQLETRVVMEARRCGMDWKRISGHQGFNSSQAASQRYQRLTTRLEEIRQGIR